MTTYISKGETLCLSSGIADSYSREGPYKALKSFDLAEVAASMEPELSDLCDKYDRLYGFHDYLQQQGYIEKIDCRDFQLGQFGEFEIEEIVESG